MFKHETIVKYIALGNEIKNDLLSMDLDKLDVTFSNGNMKVPCLNVSIAPIFSCKNCKHCKDFCYDIKACLRFTKNVFFNRMKNLILATYKRDKYFSAIENRISRRRINKYFRWHVGGDILDYDYFVRMVEIARNHPDFTFWTYTKMYHIVNRFCDEFGRDSIPANFSIMFSEWDGMEMENPYNFPIFAVKMQNGNKNHPNVGFFDTLYKCTGHCADCIKNHRGCIAGESSYTDEH